MNKYMKRKKAYLIGIKGIAMTALAVFLKEKGYFVTGSDVSDIFPTDSILKKQNIPIKEGFDPKNIDNDYNLVAVTGAHGGMTNPEADEAKKRGLTTLMHGQVLGNLMQNKIGISVCGCHGKTTTSALLAFLLTKARLDPSYIIGTSDINGLGPAGHMGCGDYFVAEADEYMTCPKTDPTPRFLWQNPKIMVITNIEYDHPDAFADIGEVKKAFLSFASKVPNGGLIVACNDNENVREILSQVKNDVLTYGFSPQADFRIKNYSFGDGLSFGNVSYKKLDLGQFMLKIPGKHNLLNALAASIVASHIGISWDKIKETLSLYTGCKRRFEKIGQFGKIYFYDDYAHHPTEIAATISAARGWFTDKRIIVIFQPHTFSRTKALFTEFAKSFINANLAIITDIYSSKREKFDDSVSSKKLVLEMNRFKNNAVFLKNKDAVLSYLSSNIAENDVLITMGAGDIFTWQKEISTFLKEKFV